MKYDRLTVKAWAGQSQWRAWQADLARFREHGYSGFGSEGFWALTLYRMQRSVEQSSNRKWLFPIRALLAVAKKLFTCVTHINLHPKAEIGPGLLIPHVGLIQVHPEARIGADCAIHQVCTIGALADSGAPVIGDHVMIGCHTCILGAISIGNNAKIGAGAVVVSDIPANATAIGVPAKPLGLKRTKSCIEDFAGSIDSENETLV